MGRRGRLSALDLAVIGAVMVLRAVLTRPRVLWARPVRWALHRLAG